MFAYLKGILQAKEALNTVIYRAIIEIGGFGLELQISQNTAVQLPSVGEETLVQTVFSVKETEFLLFGFATVKEKELFLLLTAVSGIGPKLALAVLGTLTPEQLSEAILEDNDKLISQAPGVGAKVAQRIILELKTKIENWQHKNLIQANSIDNSVKKTGIIVEEARNVLSNLGYSSYEINHAFSTLKNGQTDVDLEGLIRDSLKILGTTSVGD